MTKRVLRRFVASVACMSVLAVGGCPPPATTLPTFTSGSGGALGTVSDGTTSFDLLADSKGDLSSIASSAGGSFSVDPDGNLLNLTSTDGATLDVTHNSDDTLTVAFDDPELGRYLLTLAAGGFPIPTTSQLRQLTIHEVFVTEPNPTAMPLGKDAPRLAVDDELDSQTFCMITNGCAIVELYLELFLGDLVNLIEADIRARSDLTSLTPRSVIEVTVNAALQPYREFCQEWNALIAELDENPCFGPADGDDGPQGCLADDGCNTGCPDFDPDPDCSNAELCAAKEFCCIGDGICDIQGCNASDPDCTNALVCDRLGFCCDDDDICQSGGAGFECPTPDADCAFCANADGLCIEDCDPPDPDCGGATEAFTILSFSNSIDDIFLNTQPINAGLLPVQLSGDPAMPTISWTGLTEIFSLEVTSGGRAVYGIQGEALGPDEFGVPQFVTFAFSSVIFGTYGQPGTVPMNAPSGPLGPADAVPLTPGSEATVSITVLFQGLITMKFRVN